LDQNDSSLDQNCYQKLAQIATKKSPKFLTSSPLIFLDFWRGSRLTLRNGKFSKLSRKQKRAATRERERERETEREKRGREKKKKKTRKKEKRKRPPKSTKVREKKKKKE
jgi:hypothetical protein